MNYIIQDTNNDNKIFSLKIKIAIYFLSKKEVPLNVFLKIASSKGNSFIA